MPLRTDYVTMKWLFAFSLAICLLVAAVYRGIWWLAAVNVAFALAAVWRLWRPRRDGERSIGAPE